MSILRLQAVSDTRLDALERPLDPKRFRGVLRAFATGVTVVSSAGDEPPYGVTANAFTAVSLVPPLVLVCLSGASSGPRMIARNRAFAVNVLIVLW